MRWSLRWLACAAVLCVCATARAAPRDRPGWELYERLCLACHGEAGDGRGPAAPLLSPAPRDFTAGALKWPAGRAIELGVPGTAMPAFGAILTRMQLAQVGAIVDAYGAHDHAVYAAKLAPPPPIDAAAGRAAWDANGCPRCHPKTYDLAAGLHTPRAPGDDRRAIAAAISDGLDGTAMPSYAGTADVWRLADYVLSVAKPPVVARGTRGTGPWPIGLDIPPQGAPPAALAPAEASLSANQCARCHAKQAREWSATRHAGATSPGFRAETEFDAMTGRNCYGCHAPLAEQATDAGLRAEAATCAGCHVRGWTREGPPNLAPSLLRDPLYPLVTDARFERADFCAPCHQLPPRTAVAGKPLLDTYAEWLAGPYQARGIQCQSCHMPNREHTWLGIHDPGAVRQGLAVRAHASGGLLTVELENVGAGHMLPTTTTPALWLRVQSFAGDKLLGEQRTRIGRDVWWDGTAWHEREDTRIAPGTKRITMQRMQSGATRVHIAVDVAPDDYYEGVYTRRLAEPQLPPAQRALYEEALRRARASHFTAQSVDVALESRK
ncbi:MAG TPA: c-type cytochrome [Kofleriaceae bacterium]|jgi:mono/diheme cytochrome c family protein